LKTTTHGFDQPQVWKAKGKIIGTQMAKWEAGTRSLHLNKSKKVLKVEKN